MKQNTQYFQDETAESFFKNANILEFCKNSLCFRIESVLCKAGTIMMWRIGLCAANQPNTYTTAR